MKLPRPHRNSVPSVRTSAGIRRSAQLLWLALLAAIPIALAGCSTATVTANATNATFSLSPGAASIDTNCTGCNAINAHGTAVQRFAATLSTGGAAGVTWSLSGGDPGAGPGKIDAAGNYTPPSYLTADRAEVVVTARLTADPHVVASAGIAITPGFLEPLSPENLAMGAGNSVTLTSRLAVAGGGSGVQFSLAKAPNGAGTGIGSLGVTSCQHSGKAFTTCTVTYTAPAAITSTEVTYIVARAEGSTARTETEILLNSAGVTSNPTGHQTQLPTLMALGSSGGNNNDFDAHGNVVADCCSGTLGALIQDNSGRQYLLSNNHVLARSDHAAVGDTIVQPGLIDNNCTPNGDGAGTVPVGSLTAWLSLKSPLTNADAAIAQVASRTVDSSGSILELGTRQPDGTLSAAPPGVTSTGGKGESAGLQMRIAKSGRTTGLTCGSVSALGVDVSVDYYRDCGETRPYLTKTFTNQVAVSGDRFSDAGDSGALLVDATNAEPVGLFFAGGIDTAGVGQGVANPAGDVLAELGAQSDPGITYNFVGGPDHPVSCLSYGDSTVSAAQTVSLSDHEIARAQQALAAARQLVNPALGILGVSPGKSTDLTGEAAIVVYIDENATASVPPAIDGVRTLVIPTNARAVSLGTAPLANTATGAPALSMAKLNQALTIKHQVAADLMRKQPAFFGVGVAQSLDDPREAALLIYVDRQHIPATLPQTISGLRTRYVIMDRLHVTRSYATTVPSTRHCLPHSTAGEDSAPEFEPTQLNQPLHLD